MLETSLVALTMATIAITVFAQSGVAVLQRGVSVQQPVASNAVAVPNADTQGAPVVALTADGSVYIGVERLQASVLADRVRTMLSARNEKTLYIKADARVPYSRLVEVIDAVWKSGIEGLTLLTAAQPDAPAQTGRPVSPKGLEMRLIRN
jgi:biopolymer transport protein TolR